MDSRFSSEFSQRKNPSKKSFGLTACSLFATSSASFRVTVMRILFRWGRRSDPRTQPPHHVLLTFSHQIRYITPRTQTEQRVSKVLGRRHPLLRENLSAYYPFRSLSRQYLCNLARDLSALYVLLKDLKSGKMVPKHVCADEDR